jgi:PAS domain S-box-containing protein
LEAAGFQVLEADSGAACEAALAVAWPDIVLLDVTLPDTHGFDLTRRIKARAADANQQTAAVLISASFRESQSRVEGLESGADGYLIEPVSDTELVASIQAFTRGLHVLRHAIANEQLLDALFEHIPEGVTVADAPDVTIRRVSRYGIALTGRSEDALVGIPAADHPDRWAIYRPDGLRPAAPQELPLTRSVVTGEVITDEEWVMKRADGRHVTILCNAGPIRDRKGRVTGGVIAWRDITERKDAERALRAQAQALREADTAKTEFLAVVSHELRQPLHAARAALAVMKMRPERGTGEKARDALERQIDHMATIVDDLLDATRVVRGQVSLNLQPADLRDILQTAIETTRASIIERQQRLAFIAPEVPVPVHADAGRLRQVFVNLLSNASRYTPHAGAIDVHLDVSASEATVRVTDTGVGIAPDHLPHMFTLFSRGTTEGKGLGIGLAVARTLVELHRGTITARSAGVGHGSEFTVSLPTAAAVDATAEGRTWVC